MRYAAGECGWAMGAVLFCRTLSRAVNVWLRFVNGVAILSWCCVVGFVSSSRSPWSSCWVFLLVFVLLLFLQVCHP